MVERLKKNGVLPTAQRLRIAALLLASPQHLTAEQILCRLREGGMRISKAKFALIGHMKNFPVPLIIESARAAIDHHSRPSFAEVFDGLRGK